MALKTSTGNFFEDCTVGKRFQHATPRTITHGDTALYLALTGSRNPLHCSEPFAQSHGHPTAPVDDLLVFHIAFGKTVPDISYNAVANLGYAECVFHRPVYVGDTLRAETTILGRKANSNGKTGVVYVRSTCFNQRDEVVLSWARWVMVNRREATSSPDRAPQGQTDFAASVPVSAIAAPAFADDTPTRARPHAAVGRGWESIGAPDITEGRGETTSVNAVEPIIHPAGITIDESDHTLATKLYQNNARVHFDLHHMKNSRFGRRLVYGGQVISICRALSYDGLENALSIAAINSGEHVNPTFAGDTIYAMSLPVAKWLIDDHLGAVRMQLHGFKNIDPDAPGFGDMESEHHVLSLDYTVLMLREPH